MPVFHLNLAFVFAFFGGNTKLTSDAFQDREFRQLYFYYAVQHFFQWFGLITLGSIRTRPMIPLVLLTLLTLTDVAVHTMKLRKQR